MKIHFSLVIVVVLLLPLSLTACSNKGAENAEKYIEAVVAGDRDEAARYVCDENREVLTADSSFENVVAVRDIECKEDGKNVVRCFFKISDGEDVFDFSTRFFMDGDKVCGVIDEGD